MPPALAPGRPTLVRGRQNSLPRRTSFKSITRGRTPPLHTRERNRQKVESALQEQQRAAEEARYEKFLQPEIFSVPKSFTGNVSNVSLMSCAMTSMGRTIEVQQPQPPPSLINSASTISPAMSRHRPSDGIGLSQDEVSQISPSKVPKGFDSNNSSPDDKENQPPTNGGDDGLHGDGHDGSTAMVWEDPGSSSAEKEANPHPFSHDETCEAWKEDTATCPGSINVSRQTVSSLVQEKISLWETFSTTQTRLPKTSASSTSTTGGSTRGRSSVSNSSWYRCFSDMARNMRQESAQMTRLMDRLREVGYDELGSPFSTRSTEASSPGEDLTESPDTQKIKAQLVDMHRHLKLTKKMYRAMDGLLRMRSLDQAFANVEGQQLSKSASLSLSTSPSSPKTPLLQSGDFKEKDIKVEAPDELNASRNSRGRRSSRGEKEVSPSPKRFPVPGWMRPELGSAEADGAEGDDATVPEEDVATNTSSQNASPCSASSPENAPLPGQEGMPRHETILYHLEQQELHRQVTLIVPEGMDDTRRVNFVYEEQEMTVTIPQGYNVGQQVTVQVPTKKRPPLERNATQAWHRGRQHLPDRHLVMENLRHCCRVTTSISLDHPEYKSRYQLYGMLQGKSMTPMLPEMPEADEDQDSPGK